MADKGWYIERWESGGTKAKWHGEVEDFAAVRVILQDVKNVGTGEIVRVLAPADASASDLTDLEKLGGQRLL